MQIELREYQKQDFKALELSSEKLGIMMILVHQKRRSN